MNQKFKILWFEDEYSWYKMELDRIKEILKIYNLDLDDTRKTGANFKIEEICGNSFDLILMDFKLAAGTTGDEITSALRTNNILTDVLFYSSQIDQMIDKIYSYQPPLDGIYFSDRKIENFNNKLENLIIKIIKRSEDLINLRGFVMDNSCDFEVRIHEILHKSWDYFNEKERETLDNKVIKKTGTKMKYFIKSQGKIQKISSYKTAIDDFIFFNFFDKLHLLNLVIEMMTNNHSFIAKEEHNKFIELYMDDILHYRNALGHKKCLDNTIKVKDSVIPIDEDFHKMMRLNISNVDSLIRDIEIHLDR